eukprot:TRINITY_DN2671_c0_g1_i2.p2 TRINITY_DN2671_c0_g1~~TRINITY_DN2671_c0_g1_i2.p2  ORF type:complete len:208 (+),score=70.20 TRINITY_DN2671_c0_g1_i2:48-671(+)
MAEKPMIDVSRWMTGPRAAETEKYVMQQTMVRVKDPTKSLEFYCDVLGFKLIMHRDFQQWGFSVYFVAMVDPATIPTDPEAQWAFCMNTPGCVELTWNHGSEKEEGRLYNTGNSCGIGIPEGAKGKGGFGHMGITVPCVYEACARFDKLGVEFHKTPNGGGMKGLAFIKDPDGYLIEVLPQGPMIAQAVDHAGVPAEGGKGYTDNSK